VEAVSEAAEQDLLCKTQRWESAAAHHQPWSNRKSEYKMKRKFISTVVGVSVMLLSLVGAPAYGSGGSHGGGGHGGGFSGGGHFGGTGHGYSGAGISHGAGGYGASHYASGISTGRYVGHSGYRGYGKGTMHREAQLDGRFIVLLPVRKAEPLPGSLLGRQIDLEVTTFPVINPALALRANPASSNTLAQLQRVQPGPTGLGRDRMQPTGSDSTRKQNKGCVTGKAKRLDTPTPNVITMNTGKIASTMTMTGGVTIATLSFLLGEVFGAGLTAGGIRPGGTTRIIRTTIITARSMVMTACNQTR
jgi:hypothetical protein